MVKRISISSVLPVMFLLALLACDSGDEEQLASSVEIVNPADSAVVIRAVIEVTVSTTHFDPDQNMIIYQLNENTEHTLNGLAFTVEGLLEGKNAIRVSLKRGQELIASDAISIYYIPAEDSVTVVGGTGTGRYEHGATVVIEADDAEVPFVFDYWDGDTEFLLDSSLNPTFFKMPEQAVRLEAVYKVDSAYYRRLIVTHGTGGGIYLPGEMVQVSLAMKEPLIFTHWSGGNDFLADDSLSTSFSFAMPDRDVNLIGRWEVLNVSFSKHLYPIIENQCNDAGCHGANGSSAYLTHDAIAADGQSIVAKTRSGNMPPPTYGQLSEEELEIIRVWVEEGMKDN